MAAVPERPTAVERTFAFVDLAGFTALTEAHGDEVAVELVDHFVALARTALADEDQLVKSLGDAVMLTFASPQRGLDAVARLLAECHAEGDLPMPRSGLHHGPAIERDGDWFGATVNLAARVAAQAQGCQTLATAPVATTARAQGVGIVDLGCFRLRNVHEPVELYELALSAPAEATSVDPVCRMQVRHEAAAGRLRHGERDYWFCSLQCVKDFVDEPRSYVTGAPEPTEEP